MPKPGDTMYQVGRIEHDEVDAESLSINVSKVVAALQADAEGRDVALDWNTVKMVVESAGFGRTPDHEIRVTATVL